MELGAELRRHVSQCALEDFAELEAEARATIREAIEFYPKILVHNGQETLASPTSDASDGKRPNAKR